MMLVIVIILVILLLLFSSLLTAPACEDEAPIDTDDRFHGRMLYIYIYI